MTSSSSTSCTVETTPSAPCSEWPASPSKNHGAYLIHQLPKTRTNCRTAETAVGLMTSEKAGRGLRSDRCPRSVIPLKMKPHRVTNTCVFSSGVTVHPAGFCLFKNVCNLNLYRFNRHKSCTGCYFWVLCLSRALFAMISKNLIAVKIPGTNTYLFFLLTSL